MAIAKLILFIFNTIFFLFGVATLAVGIWLRVRKDELSKFINLLDGQTGSNYGREQIDAVTNQSGLIVISAYVLIGVGCFTLLVGFCGCCGAIKESQCLLYTYADLIGIILTSEVVAVVLVVIFQSRVRSVAENALLNLQNNYFVSIPSYQKFKSETSGVDGAKAAVTYLLNLVQVSFDCCGAHTVGDISNSSSWLRSDLSWKGRTLVRPMTCCQLRDSSLKTGIKSPAFNWSTFDENLLDPNCSFVEKNDKRHSKSCYNALLESLQSYATPLIGCFVGIVLVEIVGIVSACRVACRHRWQSR